jgi:hypothetical protein
VTVERRAEHGHEGGTQGGRQAGHRRSVPSGSDGRNRKCRRLI